MNFDFEKTKFEKEVDLVAANLVRKGIATPYEAIRLANRRVLSKRRKEYNQSLEPTTESLRNKD